MSKSTTSNDIPTSSQIITKEFLESQLNKKIDHFTVENGTKPGDNYMSVLYSISVQFSSSNNDILKEKREIQHYLLKCYPSHPARQKFLNKVNYFYKELQFYSTLATDLVQFQIELYDLAKDDLIQLAIPPYHGGKAVNFSNENLDSASQEKIYNTLENFILMTDMRKAFAYKMADRTKGLDVDHMKLSFFELATLHALSWTYRKKVEWDLVSKYPFLTRSTNIKRTEMWLGILKENVATAVAAIDSVKGTGNVLSKAITNFCERARPVLEYFYCQDAATGLEVRKLLKKTQQDNQIEDNDHWRVVCHGDCWTNNMLFQYNKKTGKPQHVVLVDFPLAKLGCPTLDLACLVYTSTRRDFRQTHLQECFQVYHDRFVEICDKLKVECLPGFSMDSIKSRFQICTLVGLYISLISLPLNLIGEDKEVNLEKMDEKSSMGEMFQEACTAGMKGSPLYQEWILELVEDLYDDGII